MTVIYVDILLALNLFVDFLLLSATARLLRRPTTTVRQIVAAVLGALSSLIILAPPLSSSLSLLYKAGTSALMVLCGFPFAGLTVFLKTTAVLWIISALFSGVMTVGFHLLSPVGLFVQSGVFYYNVSPLLLVLLTTVSYGVLRVFDRLTRKRVAFHCAYRLDIVDGDTAVTIRALLDSGHSLQEPFSGTPVILVSKEALRGLGCCHNMDEESCLYNGHIRCVPFSSVGGDGMLTAFRPARVTLHADGRLTDISGVWIAPITALGRGEYDALIGPAVSDLLFCHVKS